MAFGLYYSFTFCVGNYYLTATFSCLLYKYMTDQLPKFSLEVAIKRAEEKKGRGPVKSITLWLGDDVVADYEKLQNLTKNAFGKHLKKVTSILIKQTVNEVDKAS